MKMLKLDHVNVLTTNLAEMTAWYDDILELRSGARPDFGFGGAWLYCGDDPIVHLVEATDTPKSIEPKIEHFAISATGMTDFIEKLKSRDITYQISEVPAYPVVQVNIADYDGNHIHIDFSADEADGLV